MLAETNKDGSQMKWESNAEIVLPLLFSPMLQHMDEKYVSCIYAFHIMKTSHPSGKSPF